MVTCPKCNNTLIGAVETCQFCGAFISAAPAGAKPRMGGGQTRVLGSGPASNTGRGVATIICYIMGALHLVDAIFLFKAGEKMERLGPFFTFWAAIKLFVAISLFSGWGWWLTKAFMWLGLAGGLVVTAMAFMGGSELAAYWLGVTLVIAVTLWAGYKSHGT